MNNRQSTTKDDQFPWFVASLAAVVSLLSFLYYFQRGEILLYGDAVAHINIARRLFDSQTPGLLQLGTVWLPLPHLLMVPFLVSDWMWTTGIGGSIPSMIAYVFSVVGIFRLTVRLLEHNQLSRASVQTGGWIAALAYGANPNLIYLQATAMTEALYLGFSIWAVMFLVEFLEDQSRISSGLTGSKTRSHTGSLFRCALCLAGAELTRYEGWFVAAIIGAVVVVMAVRRWSDGAFRRTALKFLITIAIAPLAWLMYNAIVYDNALEFANGPYSAKAIELRTSTSGQAGHPGSGNLTTSASFFLKSAQLDVAQGNWGRVWLVVVLAAFIVGRKRARYGLLLLSIPIVFYALSISYGGVPLFLPAWWPFTWYNLRYGLQLLPLFAVSAAVVVTKATSVSARETVDNRKNRFRSKVRLSVGPISSLVICAGAVALISLSYIFIWHAQPLCFTEAWINSRTKLALQSAVASRVSLLPRNAEYLAYVGDHVGVFQRANVPLRRVINEGNHRQWKKPSDQDGLWERALADPTKYVDFVIAYEGDAVDLNVRKDSLTLLDEIHTTGQPRGRIYAARAATNQSR